MLSMAGLVISLKAIDVIQYQLCRFVGDRSTSNMIGGEGIIRSIGNNDWLSEERCGCLHFRNGKCLTLAGPIHAQVTILCCPERPFDSMMHLFIAIMAFDLLRSIFVNCYYLLQGVSVVWFQLFAF
jgi:hypothetical protein